MEFPFCIRAAQPEPLSELFQHIFLVGVGEHGSGMREIKPLGPDTAPCPYSLPP